MIKTLSHHFEHEKVHFGSDPNLKTLFKRKMKTKSQNPYHPQPLAKELSKLKKSVKSLKL